jgi:hypothetical protein
MANHFPNYFQQSKLRRPNCSSIFPALCVLVIGIVFPLQAQKKPKPTQGESSVYCPPEGNAKVSRVRDLNTYKNRTQLPAPKDFDQGITLKAMLQPGDDTRRWSVQKAASVSGYVRDVKPGGVETTNCKCKDKSLRDTHIELVLDPLNNDKNKCVVVEVTPRVRSLMAKNGLDWSTPMLRSKFLGRWVTVEGWMLFDFEHSNMAENTRPGNPKNWRGTAWEIHPLTAIKLSQRR